MKLGLLMLIAACLLQAQSGSFTIHLILHAIGEERYEMQTSDEGVSLNTTFEYSDRGNKRTTKATMRTKRDYTPVSLEVQGQSKFSVKVVGEQAQVEEELGTRIVPLGRNFLWSFGPSPFALQMMMLRYWNAHGKPRQVPVVRFSDAAEPIQIERVGTDTITSGGKEIALERFTVANLMFGREVLWMDAQGDLAAAMTFAGGLPMEAVKKEYETALPELYRSGVRQEMADLAALGKLVPPETEGAFAIVGARLVDGTGAAPIDDSVVIIRNGRIASAGPRIAVQVPTGMQVVDGKGQTLLPGLWEMHTHFSGVEFGPALLAAGITTARDCGGEFEYLVAQRDALEKQNALGPRLLLAGLVDAGGLKAFGHVTAETPEQGRAVVNMYHRAGFQQIKLYTYLMPEVVRAITAESHRLGMSVTGHVPQALNAFEGVEAGMDQINHLFYVSKLMTTPDERQKAVQFFKDHHTVVDPTISWGEMASHAKETEVSTFEPGIEKAPFVLSAKYRGMHGAPGRPDGRAQNLAAVGALHRAGVAIVPGSDTGLVGYGLHREIELYVQAGMTPMEAIQSATIVSARAMGLERDSGTVEVGKRADFILVNGDPLQDIRELRKVSRVIANGRVYDPAKLWRSVGFQE